jgi:Bacterial pre-peptidase C-terminal domain
MPTRFNNTSLTSATIVDLSTSSFMTLDGLTTNRTSAVYQFSLNQASGVKAAIHGLTGNLDLALVRDRNSNGIAEDIEIIRSSIATGTVDETLDLFNLESGTYHLIVTLGDGVSGGDYRLQVSATTEVQQDVLWRNSQTGKLGVWRFNGTTYQGSQSMTTQFGTDWKIESGLLEDKGFVDFNGDRSSDLLLRKSTGELRLLLLENSQVLESLAIGTGVTTQDVLLGMGDFNGDGMTDLLWRNSGTGTISLWQLGTSLSRDSQCR